MNDVKRRIYNNRIGLGFAIAVLVYIISLYPELLTFRSEAQSFPFIFMTLTLAFALIKILLDLTGSKYLYFLDNISLVSKSIKSSTETVTKEEFLHVMLFFVFFLIIYLFGFLVSVFSYTFLVTYIKYRNLKLPTTVSVLLTTLAYAFDILLPGGLWEGVVFK